MERLRRFDIAAHGAQLMVVVESDLLPPDAAIVVIPLIADYPAVQRLTPAIRHDGRSYILATRLISAVRRSALKHVGTARPQADEITRAIDILLAGV